MNDKMDCTIPFTAQPEVIKDEIRYQVSYTSDSRIVTRLTKATQCTRKFPSLRRYQDAWVVDDMMRSRLKYQKSVVKKKKNEQLADQSRRRMLRKSKRQESKGKGKA